MKRESENVVVVTPNKSMAARRPPSQTKGHALYHAVRRAILLREFQPGDPLTEQQIGAEFYCSQGTVREALMRLQEEGLVQRRGYRGTTVSNSSLAEVVRMAEIRMQLELDGIRLAVDFITDRNLAELEGYLAEMEQAVAIQDNYALSELDRTFHMAIFHCSGLVMLEPILTRCMLHMHLRTFGNAKIEDRIISPTDAHQPILDALRDRNADKAVQAMQHHIDATIALWAPPLKSAMDAR